MNTQDVPSKRKKGGVKFEGSSPMSFTESDETFDSSLTPQQEEMSRAVGTSIRDYLRSTEQLAKEKYQRHIEAIPAYLAQPGNVLIAICLDGIVIRYEIKGEERRQLNLMFIPESIAQAATLLSQRLVFIETPNTTHTVDETFGVEFKLGIHSPIEGASKELMSTRIWFHVAASEDLLENLKTIARPYRLLSVRNQLIFEVHGEVLPDPVTNTVGQPFISKSSIRFDAGWDCIEVFPSLDIAPWKSETAPLWADNDLLAAILIAQTEKASVSSLDPRASTRRQYAALLAEFKELLDSNPEREQILQAFLQKNSLLLCPNQTAMWPKLAFGATITDFVFRDANQDYLLVELERSTLSLFRQDGHQTAELTHALGQITDWKRYIEDNLQTVQRELKLNGITSNPQGLVVIGRSDTLLPENRRKLQAMRSDSPKLRVMTYDDIYDNAKAILENLLGPLWDSGGTTEIIYPSTK